MTQTVLQTLTNAFIRVGIVDETRSPSAQQTANGMNILNNYLATQMRDGWKGLGYYPQNNPANNIPLRDADIYDVETVLCKQLAINYQVILDPVKQALLINEIDAAIARLDKRYLMYFESDLSELPRPQGGPWGGPNWL